MNEKQDDKKRAPPALCFTATTEVDRKAAHAAYPLPDTENQFEHFDCGDSDAVDREKRASVVSVCLDLSMFYVRW